MSALKSILSEVKIEITKYDPDKSRSVYLSGGSSLTVGAFTSKIVAALGEKLAQFPDIISCINSPAKMIELIEEYFLGEGATDSGKYFSVPKEFQKWRLNVDTSAKEPGMKRFICTTVEGFFDPEMSGQVYLDACGMSTREAVSSKLARFIVPRYMPHGKVDVTEEMNPTTKCMVNYFNTYRWPEWKLWKKRNPEEWDNLPDELPKDIKQLIKHLFPLKEERKYFFTWLYTSMVGRSYVYLVLCGAPGAGKNRLKLMMRALHGAANTADIKKETFGANDNKFNGQMVENTLGWADEVPYGPDMEPRMKEYQNDYISIENKGVDATRSTPIYMSMVLSNNNPRDNYIHFDSRKFAPLVLANYDLKHAMDYDQIGVLSGKLDSDKPELFDVRYVAQIAKWVLKMGEKSKDEHKDLEYRGPMFWRLAHTSMAEWQNKAYDAVTIKNIRGKTAGWNEEKQAFLWSEVSENLKRRKDIRDYKNPLTVKRFFESHCDLEGNKSFIVTEVDENESSFVDFWIKPIKGASPRKTVIENKEGKEDSPPEKPKLARPPGISQFNWRQMKDKYYSDAEATPGDASPNISLNGKSHPGIPEKILNQSKPEQRKNRNEDTDLL